MRWNNVLPIVLLLAGCSSERQLLPDEGPTTLEVYQRHMAGEYPARPDAAAAERSAGTVRVTGEPIVLAQRPLSRRAAERIGDLRRDFRRVPNPEVLGYVYSHRQGNLPVPGYFTVFPLYTRDHYARPGEGTVEMRQ